MAINRKAIGFAIVLGLALAVISHMILAKASAVNVHDETILNPLRQVLSVIEFPVFALNSHNGFIYIVYPRDYWHLVTAWAYYAVLIYVLWFCYNRWIRKTPSH